MIDFINNPKNRASLHRRVMSMSGMVAILAVLLFGLGRPQEAVAQSGYLQIQGYVYNIKDGKPLSNVYVTLIAETRPGEVGFSLATTTDTNGLFVLEGLPLPSQEQYAYSLRAICTTRRRVVENVQPMFSTLLPDVVYAWNFYLALPGNERRCR